MDNKEHTANVKKKSGFTLIELVVVMGIIGIFAAITLPSISGYTDQAEHTKAISNAQTVYTAAAAFDATNNVTETAGEYSFSQTDLSKLLDSHIEIVAFDSTLEENQAAVKVTRSRTDSGGTVVSPQYYTVRVYDPTESNNILEQTY